MLINLLIFLFSLFLLFSCSKQKNQKVITEPTDEEKGQIIYLAILKIKFKALFTVDV